MKQTFFLILLLTPNLAQAQTIQYVSDTVEVPLRAGTSTRYKIIRMLPGGTRVEILQSASENDYTLVKTGDGNQGWILSRHLMDTPGARERLAMAEGTLGTLQAEHARLRESHDLLVSEKSDLETHFAQISEENQRLRQNNQDLADRQARDWFLAGGGVLLLGLMLGLIIPRLRRPGRNRWEGL
jgi:SH3 domain protein